MPDSCTSGQMAADGLFQAIRAFKIGPVLGRPEPAHLVERQPSRRPDRPILGRGPGRGESGLAREWPCLQVRQRDRPRSGSGRSTLPSYRSPCEGRAESGAEAVLSNLMAVDSGNGETSIQAGFPSENGPHPAGGRGAVASYSHASSSTATGRSSTRISAFAGPATTRTPASWCTARRSRRFSTSRRAIRRRRTIDRLPPRLRGLLAEFCWRSEADLVNTVAYLLEGVLVNHFISRPHPVAPSMGISQSIGKTLVVQAVACILDGLVPNPIELSRRRGALQAARRRDPRRIFDGDLAG